VAIFVEETEALSVVDEEDEADELTGVEPVLLARD
jgi:hypothetical protein